MKRYCQTLSLKDDPHLVEKYIEVHSHVWPEIIEVQLVDDTATTEIYAKGRNLFMIVDTVDDFDWERDMARLATLPRQAEWEAYVSQFQGCSPEAKSTEKWQLMTKIFDSEK